MSKLDQLGQTEKEIRTIVQTDGNRYGMVIAVPKSLSEAAEVSPLEIGREVRDRVLADIIVTEERKKLNGDGSTKTTVGYTKQYATNWDEIFGNKFN